MLRFSGGGGSWEEGENKRRSQIPRVERGPRKKRSGTGKDEKRQSEETRVKRRRGSGTAGGAVWDA